MKMFEVKGKQVFLLKRKYAQDKVAFCINSERFGSLNVCLTLQYLTYYNRYKRKEQIGNTFRAKYIVRK